MSNTDDLGNGAEVLLALSPQELLKLLVEHLGLKSGIYNLAVEFQIGTGTVGPKGLELPGAYVGLGRLGVAKAEVASAFSFDAGERQGKKARKPTK